MKNGKQEMGNRYGLKADSRELTATLGRRDIKKALAPCGEDQVKLEWVYGEMHWHTRAPGCFAGSL